MTLFPFFVTWISTTAPASEYEATLISENSALIQQVRTILQFLIQQVRTILQFFVQNDIVSLHIHFLRQYREFYLLHNNRIGKVVCKIALCSIYGYLRGEVRSGPGERVLPRHQRTEDCLLFLCLVYLIYFMTLGEGFTCRIYMQANVLILIIQLILCINFICVY